MKPPIVVILETLSLHFATFILTKHLASHRLYKNKSVRRGNDHLITDHSLTLKFKKFKSVHHVQCLPMIAL